MSIEENMSLAYMRGKTRSFYTHSSRERRELFKQKLSMLSMNLENKIDEVVSNLSGGQRQALSIIMAILSDFKILLLDEITAALDPKTSEIVMKLAANIAKTEQCTTIMITHNMNHAVKYSDKIMVLSKGAISQEFEATTSLKAIDLIDAMAII